MFYDEGLVIIVICDTRIRPTSWGDLAFSASFDGSFQFPMTVIEEFVISGSFGY